VHDDMIFLSEICTVPEFKELLESPIVVPSKKITIIHKTIGKNLDKITISLIDMAVRNGREAFLPGIAREFIRRTKEHNGITESVLTTAVRVDKKTSEQISKLIADVFRTRVELKEVVDKDIIGGFILKIEDNYIDASVRNKLRKIEKELKSRTLTT
jgi:F-type H+-transporting ATPase subunit delta